MILVDTSVWIDHFRDGDAHLSARLQRITDELIVEGSQANSGWFGTSWGGTSRRVYEATPDELQTMTFTADEVPAADRTQIEAALRRANRPVTDDAVAELYKRGVIQRSQ